VLLTPGLLPGFGEDVADGLDMLKDLGPCLIVQLGGFNPHGAVARFAAKVDCSGVHAVGHRAFGVRTDESPDPHEMSGILGDAVFIGGGVVDPLDLATPLPGSNSPEKTGRFQLLQVVVQTIGRAIHQLSELDDRHGPAAAEVLEHPKPNRRADRIEVLLGLDVEHLVSLRDVGFQGSHASILQRLK
jgi:hypothetical protein